MALMLLLTVYETLERVVQCLLLRLTLHIPINCEPASVAQKALRVCIGNDRATILISSTLSTRDITSAVFATTPLVFPASPEWQSRAGGAALKGRSAYCDQLSLAPNTDGLPNRVRTCPLTHSEMRFVLDTEKR